MAICSLNSGSVSLMFICIGTESEFGNSIALADSVEGSPQSSCAIT